MEQLSYYGYGIKVALKGAHITLMITAASLVIGLLLGFIISNGKMSRRKPLRVITTIYIEMLRGTPLLVQVLILVYGIPNLITTITGGSVMFNWNNMLLAGIIACGINSSAYMAEVIRSGMQAVDKGQTEAARSLGMTHSMTMRNIIIPQAFKIILPALGNEFVTLIKETSILSIISIVEVTRKGQLWAASDYQTFPAYIGVAVVYLMMTIPLSRLVNYMERRMVQ